MGRLKKVVAALFSASMIISSWSMTLVHADTITNIALNKKVTTSYACSGFGAEKAVDGDKSSRWATEFGEHAATNHWIDVDLGAQSTMVMLCKEYVNSRLKDHSMVHLMH